MGERTPRPRGPEKGLKKGSERGNLEELVKVQMQVLRRSPDSLIPNNRAL